MFLSFYSLMRDNTCKPLFHFALLIPLCYFGCFSSNSFVSITNFKFPFQICFIFAIPPSQTNLFTLQYSQMITIFLSIDSYWGNFKGGPVTGHQYGGFLLLRLGTGNQHSPWGVFSNERRYSPCREVLGYTQL